MIVIEAVFEASSDARNDFIGLMRRTMAASRLEKGCVLYRFTADLERSDRFILTELWENEEDLKAHFVGEAFKNFFGRQQSKVRSISYMAWQGPLLSYVPPNPVDQKRSSEMGVAIKPQ